MNKSNIIKPGGQIIKIEPKNQTFEAEELKQIVGGEFELKTLSFGWMVKNKFGREMKMEINMLATAILSCGLYVRGQVLVCPFSYIL